MGMKIIRTCDICELDGKEGVKAIGYYFGDRPEFYDVCKKHAEGVKKTGKEIHLYWRNG